MSGPGTAGSTFADLLREMGTWVTSRGEETRKDEQVKNENMQAVRTVDVLHRAHRQSK